MAAPYSASIGSRKDALRRRFARKLFQGIPSFSKPFPNFSKLFQAFSKDFQAFSLAVFNQINGLPSKEREFAFFSPCRPDAGAFPPGRPGEFAVRRVAELPAHCR
jgi:hypothetical protein